MEDALPDGARFCVESNADVFAVAPGVAVGVGANVGVAVVRVGIVVRGLAVLDAGGAVVVKSNVYESRDWSELAALLCPDSMPGGLVKSGQELSSLLVCGGGVGGLVVDSGVSPSVVDGGDCGVGIGVSAGVGSV
jgi:hypothetical protein